MLGLGFFTFVLLPPLYLEAATHLIVRSRMVFGRAVIGLALRLVIAIALPAFECDARAVGGRGVMA